VEAPGFGLDVGAGLRAWWLDTRITLNPGALPGRSTTSTSNFADPILALRAEVMLSESIALVGYADIGGFDTSSKSTWQMLGAVSWRITDSISAHLGYRHLALERARRDFDGDFALSGPILGASFRF
jgi:opacity protein-like surface antigen